MNTTKTSHNSHGDQASGRLSRSTVASESNRNKPKNLGIQPFPPKNPCVNASPSSQSRRWQILACAFLVLATLAVYWPARHYKFVAYDDDNYVYNNPTVCAGLTWWGVEWSFVDRQANNWHPLTWLSHMLDCQLFGLHAGGPHMVNVALHCANAVLLFLLLQALMRRYSERPSLSTDVFWRNLFVAALFALHPLRVESVAWISERKDVLSGFFGLLTLLCYAKYTIASGRPQLSLPYKLAVFFFACSLLSKPMLVTLPLIMLLLDYWPLHRFNPVGAQALPRATWLSLSSSTFFQRLMILAREKWPFFLLTAIFCLITVFAQQPGLPSQHVGLFDRIETVATNLLGYFEKLLWPQNLSFLYLRPDTIPFGQFALAVLVLLSISAVACVCWQRCPAVAIGWLWFLIVLLPVCGLVSLGRLSIADRYTYLPSIGFYLMITWGLADLAAKLFPARVKQILLGTVAVIVLVVCAVLSRHQLSYWHDTQTFYEHALQVNPNNYVAKQNLNIYEFEIAHPSIRKPPPE
jgi:protein O-mannosyl-transferase